MIKTINNHSSLSYKDNSGIYSQLLHQKSKNLLKNYLKKE